MKLLLSLVIFVSVLLVVAFAANRRPSEQERVALWRQKNTWPPTWQPDSPAKLARNAEREQEIMALTGANERWENWLQFTQSLLVPKFTEKGFMLAQTPPKLHERLVRLTQAKLKDFDSIRSEGSIAAIHTEDDLLPKFIDVPFLNEIHKELMPLHEAWIGGNIKLRPTSAYGIRLYQNNTSLVMHYDKVETHVISSIVHIAHEYDDDNEPWPIEIEDHDGELHSYNLEPGQVL